MRKYLQITLKNGVHVQIGVKTTAEYKKMRDCLLKSITEYVTLIDTCTVRPSEVVLIELLYVNEEAD